MTRRNALSSAALAPVAASQTAANKHKIGLIGTGNRGTAHLAAYLQMPEANVTALSDLESSRMDSYNAKLGGGAAKYIDWRELIKDSNVDIVAIAVPNHLHPQMAIAALRAGKHVLLEKPIAMNYEAAREIQREAKRSGRTLAVGMQRRYMERDFHVQQLVESGLIGAIQAIHVAEYRGDWSPTGSQFTDPATGRKGNWRFFKRAAGSTELEFSVHAFSQVMQLVRSPLARCVASGATVHYSDHETRDICEGLIDFHNGSRLNYSFCLFAEGVPGTTVIIGDKGTLRYSDKGLLLDSPGNRGRPVPPVAGYDSSVRPETHMYREFFRAIAERRESALSAEVAIEAAKIAYAMEMAISANRIVTAKDFV
jgi:predicted dehydrogenase